MVTSDKFVVFEVEKKLEISSSVCMCIKVYAELRGLVVSTDIRRFLDSAVRYAEKAKTRNIEAN